MNKLWTEKDNPENLHNNSEAFRDQDIISGNRIAGENVFVPPDGKICVIGDKVSVSAFKGLGIEVFSYTHPNKIKKIIKELAQQGYAIILITDREAEAISDFYDTLGSNPYPVILPIPSGTGKSAYGFAKMNRNIAKSVGG